MNEPQDEAKSLKLLVVDDHAAIRTWLTTLFSELDGVEVAGEASGAIEAIRLARSLLPDVVVLDIQMPGGSGFELLEAIKKERPSLVAIVFSGYAISTYKNVARQLGADFFFDKTSQIDQLTETIRQLASGRQGSVRNLTRQA